MTVTEEMVKQMMLDCPEQNFTLYLPLRIAEVQETFAKIQSVRRRRDEERRRHQDATDRLDTEAVQIQAGCKHYASIYHGDPAGGSDSHHECPICGKVT